jgi:transcriptional regulator with XRE-family HTH domain
LKKLELSPTGREDYLRENLLLNLTGKISEGTLLKRLRKDLLGMSQSEFCKLAGISRRSLSDIENDRGPSTSMTLNTVFGIFGLRLSLLPMNAELTKLVCADFQAVEGLAYHIKRFE